MCPVKVAPELFFGWTYLILMSVAATANVILIEISVLRTTRQHRPWNRAYFNLAVTDALAATFGATVRGPGTLLNSCCVSVSPTHKPCLSDYIYGISSAYMCGASVYLSYIIFHANLFSVVPITIDRFTAVVFPMK